MCGHELGKDQSKGFRQLDWQGWTEQRARVGSRGEVGV